MSDTPGATTGTTNGTTNGTTTGTNPGTNPGTNLGHTTGHTTGDATGHTTGETTGGCLCGQLRYRIAAAPVATRICWCRDCQRIASNGTVNTLFPSAAIMLSGQAAEFNRTADSGNQVRRRFCPQCGCHLFADSTGRPGLTVVRVGTLDDPSAVAPSANIWAASAPAWACLDAGLARTEQQPAPLPPPPNAGGA